MSNRIQDGFDMLRREARGLAEQGGGWQEYEELLCRAEEHVLNCGGVWEDYAAGFKRELSDIMGL